MTESWTDSKQYTPLKLRLRGGGITIFIHINLHIQHIIFYGTRFDKKLKAYKLVLGGGLKIMSELVAQPRC